MSSYSRWVPATDRADPVALLEQQDVTGEPDLVPVRHGRMKVSPFTFYRGAAKIMAADPKDTPVAFSQRYTDQNDQDFQQFVKAVRTGQLEALEGV